MNFRTIGVTKKLLSKPTNLSNIISRNYYCEKWIKQQEIEKLKQMDLMNIETLNMNKKEIFFNNQIKKILEQNNKIQIQNEKILSSVTELQTNTNKIELLKKYITKEQYEI
jgi:hypothetical protein